MKTRHDITVAILPDLTLHFIPAGTRCDPAWNQPGKVYFVRASREMSPVTRAACRQPGILLTQDEVLRGIE